MCPSTEPAQQPARILLLMSGSIACAKASSLISAWVKRGHAVQVARTRSAGKFIGDATLEGLSGRPVLGDAFASGQVMDHIRLARWADIVVAAPATSNLVNKLAAGIADDAVTCLWQAAFGSARPMYIVPAMNPHLWNYPATQESVRRLKSWGIEILPVAEGDLACGETGFGRMLEPEDILRLIDLPQPRAATPGGPRTSTPRRILVTAGGTREAIDSVRYIGNISSGRTAAALANSLAATGHEVTWLGAEAAVRPGAGCGVQTFLSYGDLARALQEMLGESRFDVVIHAAAVSDFSVDRIDAGETVDGASRAKLPSREGLSLHLKPNPKLLHQLRGWSCNADIRIVAFKLTAGADEERRIKAVTGLFNGAGANAVVHNDLADMRGGRHPYTVYTSPADSWECADSAELALRLETLVEKMQ